MDNKKIMKIRIAFVINYIKNGGPSNVIRNLIRCLSDDEFEVTLITLFPGNDASVLKELYELGVNIIHCKRLSRRGCLIGNIQEFKQIIEENQFDIIHSHGFIPDLLSSRIRTSAYRVSTIHNIMFEDYIKTYGRVKGYVFIKMHLGMLRKLNMNVCCSESVFNRVGPFLNNVTYIRNGIIETKNKTRITRADCGIPEDATVFIYAGHLTKGKRIVWLINSFHHYHLPNEYLLVLGKGPEEDACKSIKDENVKIIGFTTDPIAYERISDIYISASESEGFSIALLEALDNGLALFVSDIDPHKEVFRIDPSIYIGECFSLDEFGEKLSNIRTKFMTIDKIKIKELKDQYLSAEEMTRQYCNLYKEGIKAKGFF